jgi:ATP/maltotriose-dependent transcriptional regulator MalT
MHGQREGLRLLEAALEIPGGTPASRARACVAAALQAQALFDAQRTITYASEAVRIGTERNDDTIVARARCWLGWGSIYAREPARARSEFEQSIRLCRSQGELTHLVEALNGLGSLEAQSGDLALARGHLEESIDVADRAGNRVTPMTAYTRLAMVALFQGRLDEAEDRWSKCLAEDRRLGHTFHCVYALVGLAEIATLRGDYGRARLLAEQARHEAESVGEVWLVTMTQVPMALAAYAAGDLAEAWERLNVALPVLELTIPMVAANLACLAADVARRAGDIETADELLARAVALAETSGSLWAAARVALGRARKYQNNDSGELAERACHQALRIARQGEDDLTTVETLDVLSGIAVEREAPERCLRLLAAADAARNKLGCSRFAPDHERYIEHIERARAVLSPDVAAAAWRDGAEMSLQKAVEYAGKPRRSRDRPSSGWDSLTPAERHVVELAGQGLTNPEIASRLFVARSTIKGHLSSVFTKLGVATRAELAAAAARRTDLP